MCVGLRFAQQEARVTLHRIFRSLEFKLEPGQEPLDLVNGLTLGPRKGIFVTVHPRAAAPA